MSDKPDAMRIIEEAMRASNTEEVREKLAGNIGNAIGVTFWVGAFMVHVMGWKLPMYVWLCWKAWRLTSGIKMPKRK